jgi:hypothetical protein
MNFRTTLLLLKIIKKLFSNISYFIPISFLVFNIYYMKHVISSNTKEPIQLNVFDI